MISNLHFKILDTANREVQLMRYKLLEMVLDTANRELAHHFEKIRKARATRDTPRIKHAEMEYYQALQHLYTAVQNAVAEGTH